MIQRVLNLTVLKNPYIIRFALALSWQRRTEAIVVWIFDWCDDQVLRICFQKWWCYEMMCVCQVRQKLNSMHCTKYMYVCTFQTCHQHTIRIHFCCFQQWGQRFRRCLVSNSLRGNRRNNNHFMVIGRKQDREEDAYGDIFHF